MSILGPDSEREYLRIHYCQGPMLSYLVGPLVWWVDIIIKIMEIDRIKLTHTISIQLGI